MTSSRRITHAHRRLRSNGNIGRRIVADALQRGHDVIGRYRTTDETIITDANGKSFITFEDYAVAVLDELAHPAHIARRFGVAY